MLIYDLERTLHLNKNTIVQPIEINAKEIVHFKFKTYNAYRLFKDVYCVSTPSLNLEFENNEKIANINNFIFEKEMVNENVLFFLNLFNNKKTIDEIASYFEINDLLDKKIYLLDDEEKLIVNLICLYLSGYQYIFIFEANEKCNERLNKIIIQLKNFMSFILVDFNFNSNLIFDKEYIISKDKLEINGESKKIKFDYISNVVNTKSLKFETNWLFCLCLTFILIFVNLFNFTGFNSYEEYMNKIDIPEVDYTLCVLPNEEFYIKNRDYFLFYKNKYIAIDPINRIDVFDLRKYFKENDILKTVIENEKDVAFIRHNDNANFYNVLYPIRSEIKLYYDFDELKDFNIIAGTKPHDYLLKATENYKFANLLISRKYADELLIRNDREYETYDDLIGNICFEYGRVVKFDDYYNDKLSDQIYVPRSNVICGIFDNESEYNAYSLMKSDYFFDDDYNYKLVQVKDDWYLDKDVQFDGFIFLRFKSKESLFKMASIFKNKGYYVSYVPYTNKGVHCNDYSDNYDNLLIEYQNKYIVRGILIIALVTLTILLLAFEKSKRNNTLLMYGKKKYIILFSLQVMISFIIATSIGVGISFLISLIKGNIMFRFNLIYLLISLIVSILYGGVYYFIKHYKLYKTRKLG